MRAFSDGRRAAAWALLLGIAAAGCAQPQPRAGTAAPPGQVMTGIDVLEAEDFQGLHNLRIGLITNQSGRDARGRPTAEVLARVPGVTLAAIFSPEHGFYGGVEEGAVSSATIRLGGRLIPIHSLYGRSMADMRPRPQDLQGLDALVFDIQDIGARFYTYLATMGMALEEAAKAKIAFIVLDRPNPITGTIVEGPLLTDADLPALSPTSYFPVPVRHGLTPGEMALLHNIKVRHPRLEIVRMRGWKREMWYDQTGWAWVPPSPNIPDLEAATLYPGIGLFEASNLSVGRGTPYPFGWVGAPWLDARRVVARLNEDLLDGVSFSAQDYTPSKSVYAGELCHGVLISITNRDVLRPLAVFRHIEQALHDIHRDDFQWQWEEVRKMTGSREFQDLCEHGRDPIKIMTLFNRDAERFETARQAYLLY